VGLTFGPPIAGPSPVVSWAPRRSVDLEKGVDKMTLPKSLQSPERDVLLVSGLISILVVLAFTDWGRLGLRGDWPGLRPAVLASAIANRYCRATHR
jgi:hypothetical protein